MSESYDIDILRQATNKVVSSTQNLLNDLLAANAHLEPSELRDVLLEAFPQIIEGGSELAATAAAEWYEDLHNKHAGGTYRAILARPINPDQLEGTVRAAVRYLYTDNPIAAHRLLHGAIQRYITSQVRDTTVRNALADRAAKRFARVPSGKTCAWCSMLASRGFVYASAKSAGALGQYHDDCNCQIVPAFGSKDPVIKGYDPASLYEDYLEARNELIKEGVTGPALDDKAIAARMRRIGDYTDSITPRVSSKAPKARSFASDDDGEKWAREHFKGLRSYFDTGDAGATYSGSMYEAWNKALREHGEWGTPLPDEIARLTRDLDTTLSRSQLPETLILHRAVNANAFKIDGEVLTGELTKERLRELRKSVQTEHAYMSTSIGATAPFSKDFHLHITVPKGTNAVNMMEISRYPDEREILLRRGLSYQITEITPSTDPRWKYDIQAEIVPSPNETP